jgi:hypothetical protein
MAGSPAQRTARARNHIIWRLRGAWANVGPVSGERRDRIRAIIDEELAELGVETEASRAAKRHEELMNWSRS